jgi:uncharacterized protein YndB with AHSA1/START domain
MHQPTFSYVIYINSTPKKLWEALTCGEITKKYWFGRRVESEWRAGAPITYWLDEGHGLDVSGKILSIAPYTNLTFTWHVEADAHASRERPSRVTIELENVGHMTKLTVTQDNFDAGSRVFHGISRAWPLLLSSLKSLLEREEIAGDVDVNQLYLLPESKLWH